MSSRVVLDGVYRFVTDGVESAHRQAVALAGDGVVGVSGSDVARQLVMAGLVDEISVHVVPVLFGSGTRLHDDLGGHVGLEVVEVVPAPSVTHIRYRALDPIQ